MVNQLIDKPFNPQIQFHLTNPSVTGGLGLLLYYNIIQPNGTNLQNEEITPVSHQKNQMINE
jgi:hypothetical protein